MGASWNDAGPNGRTELVFPAAGSGDLSAWQDNEPIGCKDLAEAIFAIQTEVRDCKRSIGVPPVGVDA
jgi:hypothetical protein